MMLSDVDKNLRGSKIYLCAKFGCSAPGGIGGVWGQRNK